MNRFKNLYNNFNETNQKINNLVDINGDHESDLIFWNFKGSLPSNKDHLGKCFFETVTAQNTKYQITNLGNISNIPVYGDFTGDGNTDYGVYEQAEGINKWYLIDGLTMVAFWERFGSVGDLPIPNDYDGDGRCDLVVYRPRNSGFYGQLSDKNKILEIHFGITGDIPVPRDYDGDNKADLAVYRLNSGSWLIKSSMNGLSKQIFLGGPDYFPIPSDYDGDGKADLAVWNHKNNKCKIIYSSTCKDKLSDQISSIVYEKLKGKKCFPVSSDFDGNGLSELAFWEYDENLLHVFKVKNNNVAYEQLKITSKKDSEPINYYLLKKFLNRNNKITLSMLYKKYKSTLSNKNTFRCDFDGDCAGDLGTYNPSSRTFTVKSSLDNEEKNIPFNTSGGELLVGDFDGEGKCDLGFVDVNNKTFTYLSSVLNKLVNISLDNKISGVPFAVDVDLDFMDDIIFYNPDTDIFGVLQSSNGYGYDEILFTEKKTATAR
ncbi:MAG: VCBS repeat-containing protein [Candidatus Melainabacteria bacterium]|nr:VCBS repeat-containing protein [Candidatus Melainabacteria bacterium]